AVQQWQQYQDTGTGAYRAAGIADKQLQSIIMIGADHKLPARNWLQGLFAQAQLTVAERKALLTGLPPLGEADVGEIVCVCFNIGAKTIAAAIKEQGLSSTQEVGRCLKAGTNCGSCLPEIKALL
ncbi:MAG: (2Fe-2S)-binding protein, partial [Methylococcales bacterium]